MYLSQRTSHTLLHHRPSPSPTYLAMSSASVLIAAIVSVALYRVLHRKSGIENIPGPPSPSWIFGNMLQLLLSPSYGDYEFAWLKLYGPIYRLKGCFGQNRLMVSDPLALQYILSSGQFVNGPIVENFVYLLFGMGSVSAVRGDAHKRLRAALNTGFTAAAVKNYQPIFEKMAHALTEQLEQSSALSINISPLLSTATLGAISEAVLGCSTKDLGEEFVSNHYQIVALAASQSAAQILANAVGALLPTSVFNAVGYLPTTAFRAIRKGKYLAEDLGRRVVREKMNAARQGLEIDSDVYSQLLNPVQSDSTKKRMSEETVVAQTSVILIAGQDTTANALAFGLVELARHPHFQDQLRVEIQSNLGASPNNVPYDTMLLLNAFIKETLRLYPAVPLVDRVALADVVIPITKEIKTSTEEVITQIPVRKGQLVTMAIASFQRLESFWGVDPHEFKPQRWLEGSPYKGETSVGPYANLLSFIGGPRTCLGWRFAILEMQVLICELVGKFSFTLPKDDAVRVQSATGFSPTMSNGGERRPALR
ncbi:Cytochrome P450 [Mycena venus]|uniref:Cytochrome P450 n=1 Tax=Mycena venus TaxID=2733690 RepID=A0A8H6YWK8_9AGAR|nr:Cytochrome P450 [Mycena venus]